MKIVTSNILAISVCASLLSPAYADEEKIAIQVLADTSGVLLSPTTGDAQKMVLLAHLKKLGKKRKYKDAQIDIISTSHGETVWSGTPKDLKGNNPKAEKAVSVVKVNPGSCNQLEKSFTEMYENLEDLEWQHYDRAHVVIFSSLIHTPVPCENVQITLPQIPPAKSEINKFLASSKIVKSIDFYWVSPDQRRIWKDFLKPTFDWAVHSGVYMRLLDEERTPPALQDGAFLEVR